MKRIALLLCAAALLCRANEITTAPDCVLQIENISLQLYAANPNWKGGTRQSADNPGFPAEGGVAIPGKGVQRVGTFTVLNYGDFEFTETKLVEGNEAKLELALKSIPGVETQMIGLVATLSMKGPYLINGKERSFPEIPADKNWQINIATGDNVIEIPLERGRLRVSGNFAALLQDNRRYNQQNVALRLMFDPYVGAIHHAKLAVAFEYFPYDSQAIELGEGMAESQPFPELAALPAGEQTLGGVRFRIPTETRFPSASGSFEVSDATAANWLYLLSALAAPTAPTAPTGETAASVEVEYTDGSTRTIEVQYRRDTGLCATLEEWDNAKSVWEEEGRSVYFAAFALDGKPLRRISFRGDPAWRLCGASTSRERITPAYEEQEWKAAANADWQPITFDRDVLPGSALDFSFLLDAPAGKYGFVTQAGEQFEFAERPGERVRFWGMNVSSNALFMPDHELDRMADRIARCGYNLVRFHHFDNPLTATSASSRQIDPERMDRLHYLFHACKQRGLYVTIDLYMSRIPRPGEFSRYPDRTLSMRDYKALVMLDPEVMQNLLEYTTALLTPVNPYTGLAWKDDPALASISLINEGTLSNNIRSDFVREAYEAASAGDDYDAFLHTVYRDGLARMTGHLKSLGVQVPLTDLNYILDIHSSFDRAGLDYVDLHTYWAHPDGYELPKTATPESSLGFYGGLSPLFAMRQFGKPFAVSEWCYVFPNAYRSEGGLVTGAYASLQNYGMLCRFDYALNPERLISPAPIIGFEQANDPISQFSDRVGALLFLRGDIQTADKSFVFPVDPSLEARNNPVPGDFRILGLIGRTGIEFDTARPASFDYIKEFRKQGLLTVEEYDETSGLIHSAGGELTMNVKAQTFQAVSPCTEAFSGPAGSRLKGKFAEVEIEDTFTSVAVTALDGQPLGESRRLLILHLTDALNTNTRFTNRQRHTLLANGVMPLLLRRGQARLTLDLADSALRCWQLDFAGNRIGEVHYAIDNGKMRLTLDNAADVMAYELSVDEGNVRVALAGSSACESFKNANPAWICGWGETLGEYFDERVRILNFAKSGRSSESFRREGRWDALLASRPDYILMALGANDAKPGDRYTDPATEYRDNLRQFARDAEAIGAQLIFVTPNQSLFFDAGKTRAVFSPEGRPFRADRLPYAESMRVVAAETGLPCFDLFHAQEEAFIALGEEDCSQLYRIDPKTGRVDPSHTNRDGALIIARLIADGLARTDSPLRAYLRSRF